MGLLVSLAVAVALPDFVKALPPGIAGGKSSPGLVRPPGAIGEEQFVQTCIRCGACVDSCPTRGLGIANMADGVMNVGTPVLKGYCMVFRGLETPSKEQSMEWKSDVRDKGKEVTCYQCINVCPSGALQVVDANHLEMGTAVVNKDYCRAWRAESCEFPCVSVCPFDAISVTVGPVVDVTRCVGCGQCNLVCIARQTGPTGIGVEPRES